MKEEAATTRTDEPAAITTGFVHGRAGSETSAAMLHAAGLLQMHRDRRSERREHMAPMNDRTGQRGERREYTAATDDRTGLVELPHQLVDRPADPPRRARLALDGTLGNEPSPATAYVLATNARTGFVEVPDQVVASPADQPRRARPSLVGALRNERSGATTGVLDRTGLVEVPDQVVASPADPPRRARPSLVGALRNEPFPATTGMPDRNGFVEVPHQLVDSPPAPPRRARPSLVGALRNAPSAATTCVLAGTALWLAAAVRIGHVVPGNDGFLSKIMPLWYVGVLLLVAAIAFARKAREPVAICAVVSLMLALTLTPALAYGMPEIQTAAKHIELVQTILHQHSLNASTGIYDTYSGFFSAIAWLCDLGSIRDSVGIATFWPCIVGLVGLAELRWLFGSLIDSRFRIWAAVTLAVLANTVEENYFSPQSLGIVLATVSYTHLDVYKRQGRARRAGNYARRSCTRPSYACATVPVLGTAHAAPPLPSAVGHRRHIIRSNASDSLSSVSYTHLTTSEPPAPDRIADLEQAVANCV